MASASTSPFVGPMFEIIVGSDQKRFLVHASILAKSEKLKAIVEGDWKEREERKVVLEGWDEATVGRLVSWLYTGDYFSPHPTKVVHSTSAVEVDMHKADGGHGTTAIAIPTAEDFSVSALTYQRVLIDANKARVANKEDPPKSQTSVARHLFHGSTIRFQEPSTMIIDRWLKRCEYDPHELDFEATLLAHAKVYALADYMLLADLRGLVYENLDCLFTWIHSRIVPESSTVGDLVTLIRYVFANTVRPDAGEEPLQQRLTLLIALNLGCFNDGEEGRVRRLMDEGGDFVTDVLEKVSRHVGRMQTDLSESRKRTVNLQTEVNELRKKGKTG